MVAIVAGNGLGLFNTSLNTLGGGGVFGQGKLGQAGGQGYVNASTGNLILRFNDEQLSGLSQELMHLRTYNAQGALSDADADGWRWDGERRLVLSGTRNAAGSTVTRTTGDGHQTVYAWNGSSYASSEGDGAHDSLVGTNSLLLFPSDWVWTDGSTRATENYDLNTGRLTSYTNPNGEKTTYSYDSNGRLSSVKDASGQELVLIYNASARLQRLDTRTASGGALTSQVYYAYDASGRLTSVSTDLTPTDNSIADGNIYTTSYSYDGSSFRIAGISQSDGTSVAYTYQLVGSEYRVRTVADVSGTTTFTYDTANRRTDVSNGLGQVWSYYYDATGQLTQVLSSAVSGQRQSTSYGYDAQGNVTSITDGTGNTVTYGYDANGNRTLERDALGDTLVRVFSSANQLQNEIRYTVPATNNGGVWTNPPDAAAQVTRYVYSSSQQLSYLVDATGVVTEYRHDSNGLIVKELQHRDASYSVSDLAPTATLSELTMASWVLLRDQTKSKQVAYSYDYRGNLVKRVATNEALLLLGIPQTTAQAEITEYVYSEYGQLLQTIAVRGANRDVRTTLSSTVYDGMGRVQSQADSNGTSTTIYSGAGRQTSVTNTAGQTIGQVYDIKGRLINFRQTASGENARISQYVYDAAGRLTMSEDDTGVRSYTLYDEAGRVSARVDGTGALVESLYNAAGQLTQEKRYAVRLDTSSWYNGSAVTKTLVSEIRPTTPSAEDRSSTRTYDTAGRLSSVVDGIGTVTSYSYDGRNQLVQVQTGNRVTRTFYDAAGRQSCQLDGEGYLRENIYDAAGQLSRVIRYGIVTTEANRATGTLAQLRPAATGALNTWYYYDNVGRQIGSVDEQGFVTESVYDEALNTLQSLRYATPYTASITASTTFASIRTAVSGGAKQTTLTAFDSMGRVAQQTAQDGTVTAYEYDTAGRLVKETAASGTAEARLLTTRYNAFGEVTGRLMGEASARIVPGMTTAQITAIYDQYGLTWSYDAAGRQVSVRDAFGNKTVSYYDEAGRLTHVVNALGEVKESLYNAFGEVKEQTGINTRLSAANVASLTGGLNATINPLVAAIKATAKDNKTIFSYDTRGLLTSKTDALGYLTSIGYNVYGEQASVTRTIAAGVTSTESYAYSRRGELLTRMEDQSGLNRVTSTAYDAFGRIISRVDGRGLTTTTTYDLNGRKITVKDPLQQTRSSEYDAWGRALTEIDAKGVSTTYNYDDVTRAITVNLPEAVTLRTVRNRHGEVASSTDGEQHATQFQYDKDGQLTITLDAKSQQALNTYDKGRLVSITDVRGGITRYGYDAAGRVVTRTDALGAVTQYDFDALGQQVRVTEALGKPEQRVTAYAYDLKGQLLTVTQDPDGLKLTTTYGYDGIGQQVRVARGTTANPDQQVVLYVYDKLGRRTAERQDPTGLNITTQYRYNGNDQVTRKIDGLNNSTWYVYDNAGRLTDTVDALGAVTRNLYDANGQITSTTRYAIALPVATMSSFSTIDQLASVSPTANAALDQVTTFAYDDNGRLESTTDALGKTESYTYDKAGNRISLTNKNGNTWNYRYDELSRLSEEITPAVTVSTLSSSGELSSQAMLLVTSIAYDAAGNVISRMEGRQRASLSALPGNDDLSQARETKYLYDAAGRQTVITSPGWYNKVTGAYQQTSDGTANTFQVTTEVSYDSLGNAVRNRVRINNAGTAADYVDSYKTYDAVGRVAHEVDALNGVTAYTYDANGHVLTTRRYAKPLLVGAVPAGRVFYLTGDIAARLDTDNANDRTLIMTYDGAGRKTSVQKNLVSLYVYTSDAALPYLGSPTTIYSYNALGQVTKETQVARNESGGIVQTGASTYKYYDKLGQQVGTVDALGYYTRQEYDVLGQLQRTVEYNTALASWSEGVIPTVPSAHSNDRSMAFAYDRLGRLTEVTQESVQYWKYDPQEHYPLGSNPAILQTGNLVTSKTAYDSLGNMIEQRDAAGNLTRIDYNVLGKITQIIEPTRATALAGKANVFEGFQAYVAVGSPKTTYALNAFGQVISETRSPDTTQAGLVQTSQVRYDAAGYVIQNVDAMNAVIDYKVDVAGRRIESRQQVSAQFSAWTGNSGYSQVLRQRYGYDGLGQQLFTQDFYSTANGESFSSKIVDYNRFGEVQSEYMIGYIPSVVLSTTYTSTYAYDQAGRITQQQSAQGSIKTEYDMDGHATRSTQVGDGSVANPDRVTRTIYDAAGRGIIQYQPRFDANVGANTLTSIVLQSVTPTMQQTYDRWSNVLTRTDQRGYVTTYSYDHANRQLTETLPVTDILQTSGLSYRAALIHEKRYDALGNLLHEVDWLGPYPGVATNTLLRTRSHTYNAVGQLTRDIDAIGANRYYMVDSNGNRVATLDPVGISYAETYDAMDRQLTHSIIRKNAQGVDTQVVLLTSKYDQAGRQYAEIDGSTEVEELFGADRTQTSQRGNVRYSLYDERGNVTQTHNESKVDRYYQFDQNNRKTRETDALSAYMTWTYNDADYGRLSGHLDLQGRQYSYSYNVFGQLAKESLRGIGALDKTYLYYGNGLLKSITEGVQTYQADGVTARLQELRTSAYEYDQVGNRTREIDSVKTFLPATPTTTRQTSSAETRLRFDELGRLAGMYAPSGNSHLVGVAASTNNYTSANEARIDKIAYEFDELGNRRRMTLDTTNQSGVRALNARWYAYNKEGMVLVGDALINSSGQFTTSWENGKSIGYSNQYDAAGRLVVTNSGIGDADVIYNGVQYNAQPLAQQTRYEYDDLGHLKAINTRFAVRSSTGTMLDPSSVRGSMTGNVWLANYTQDRMAATYDDRGHVLTQVNKTFKTDGTVDTRTDTLNSYRSDGQIIYQTSTNMVTNDIQRTYYNDAGMIDAMGNQRSYRVQVTKASGTGSYTNNYTTNYVRFDTYKESTIAVTTTQSGFTPGTTTNTYSERGELMQAAATGTAGFTRQYASNREGMVVSRREAAGTAQNYVYYQGGVVASVGNAALAELSSTLTPIWQNEFEASRPTSYVVGQGDTLGRIAQIIWGDSRMWYLIADANGLSQGANDVLLAGDTLKIPTITTSTQNNATTFKPYNPAEIIGDNTPSPNPPAPPPPPKKKCGGLLQAIVVVVAIVATVVTAGAASAALGAAATFWGSVATAAAVGAAGAVAGSIAGQLAGNLTGLQRGFSWSQVGKAALTGALTGGLLEGFGLNTGLSTALKAGNEYGTVAAYSIAQNLAGQGIARAVGTQEKFSWAGVVAAAAGGAFDMAFGGSGSIREPGKLGNFSGASGQPFSWSAVGSNSLRMLGRNVVTRSVQIAVDGHGKLDLVDAAADAFGNALGNFVVDSMAPKASAPAPAQQAQNDDVFDIEGNFKRGIGEKLDKHFEEQYQQQLQDERDTLLAEQFDREMASAKPGSIFDYDGPIITSHELSPRERATVNAVRSPGSMNPYTGEPDILTFSGALMDEAAAQARNNGPQMVATTDRDIALQRGRQAFADSLTGRGESFEMRAGRSLMDAAGLALGPEVLAIGLGTKIVQGAISLTKAGSALSTAAGRLDYSARFSDDLVNFNPGARHFSGALDEDMLLIQYHRSDRSLGQGRSAAWWTTPQAANPLGTEAAVRQSFALPPGWGPRDAVSVARIPKGAQVEYFSGTAARQMEGTTGAVA